MTSATYEQVLRVAESLPREEQLRLVEALAGRAEPKSGSTSIMELCGLGQDLWQQFDAQEYVTRERSSWNSYLACNSPTDRLIGK